METIRYFCGDMEPMKIYTQAEILDATLGPKGTPERDEYDACAEDYKIGLALRRARKKQQH